MLTINDDKYNVVINQKKKKKKKNFKTIDYHGSTSRNIYEGYDEIFETPV
jgi:hypothetical protein